MARGKITVYMDTGDIADLDELSVDLRREGLTVDRGALVRVAIDMARDHRNEWLRRARGTVVAS